MTKRSTLFLVGALGLLTLVFVVAVVGFWYASRSFCREELESTVASTDGKYIAFVYFRHCGFAAESYVHVNIFRSEEKPRGQLISGRITEGMIFAAYGRHKINVAWAGPRSVEIECPDCSRDGATAVFDQKTSIHDISVNFVN